MTLSRAEKTPILLQNSFRLFFLIAALFAALSIPLWLLFLNNALALPGQADSQLWHRHEMIFGFVGAAITGFILTAIPNWTGRLPVRGWRLLVLGLAWMAGRLAFLAGDQIEPWTRALLDMSLPVLLAATICRELLAGRNFRNLPVLGLITLFAAGDALVHAELVGLAGTAPVGLRLSFYTVVMLVALIGGRIVPSFTQNWLMKQGEPSLPAPMGPFDRIALVSLLVAAALQVFCPETEVTAVVTLICAALHAVRLLRWKPQKILTEPLLWALHLGYGWIVVGLGLLGLSAFVFTIPQSVAVHALSIGGFGTMIMAVMTRASLGHTGRELTSPSSTTLLFVCISLAAVSRIGAVLLDSWSGPALWLSGFFWTSAFIGFCLLYWPVLTKPRDDL